MKIPMNDRFYAVIILLALGLGFAALSRRPHYVMLPAGTIVHNVPHNLPDKLVNAYRLAISNNSVSWEFISRGSNGHITYTGHRNEQE